MGIPLSMEPDYETFQCQFKFGKAPIPQALPSPALCGALQYANAGALICIFPQAADEVFLTPCFQQCPSKGRIHAANDVRPKLEILLVLCDLASFEGVPMLTWSDSPLFGAGVRCAHAGWSVRRYRPDFR
jgi:hypothetical protein